MRTDIYKSFLCLFALQGSHATDFYITSPYSAVSWKAGEQARVTWDVVEGGVDVNSIDVEILDGDANNAKVISVIASGLPSDARSVAWNVPQDFQKTESVFIRVRGKGSSGVVDRYSHRFSIQDGPVSPPPEKKMPNKGQESKVVFKQQQVTTSPITSLMTSSNTSAITSENTSSLSETSTTSESITSEASSVVTTSSNSASTLSATYLVSFLLAIIFVAF